VDSNDKALMSRGYVKKYGNDFVSILDNFPCFEKIKGGSVHVTAARIHAGWRCVSFVVRVVSNIQYVLKGKYATSSSKSSLLELFVSRSRRVQNNAFSNIFRH
jgi:hypothetical protein